MSSDTQRCRQCKEVKHISEFHLKGASYSFVCKPCRDELEKKHVEAEEKRKQAAIEQRRKKSVIYNKEYQPEYRAQNAEKIKEYQREYQKARYHRLKRAIGEEPISLVGDHPSCPGCAGSTRKGGLTWVSGVKVQRWQCKQCGFTFTKSWDNENGKE